MSIVSHFARPGRPSNPPIRRRRGHSNPLSCLEVGHYSRVVSHLPSEPTPNPLFLRSAEATACGTLHEASL